MDICTLENAILDGLKEVKAQDIRVLKPKHLSELFDRAIIASGNSSRQTRALAASVCAKVKAAGGEVIGTEGEEAGEWVLVDCTDVIVHIMQPAIRQYYRLEELWAGSEN